MTFTLAPVEIPDDFEWRTKYIHLTYKGHIPVDVCLNTVRRATTTKLIGYSIVHEDTTEYTDEGYVATEGYQHTHAGYIFDRRLGLVGSRKFDVFLHDENDPFTFEQIHPHVQPKVTLTQMEILFTQYHAGRKYDIKIGKTVYKEPVMHVYHLPAEFEFNRAIIDEVVSAPSLIDACVAGQVRPRTGTDIKMLRAEAPVAKNFKHKFAASTFTLKVPTDNYHALHIHGASGFGKTKWALAQFNYPCLVKPFDSVGCLEALDKIFDPKLHDGIVFDEANLNFLSRQQVIALIDPDEDCTLDVRFKSFVLPAGIKKIFVSNECPQDLYPKDPHGAIHRRLKTLHITQPTYTLSGAAMYMAPSMQHQLQQNTPPTAHAP